MLCSNCGYENPREHRYCGMCGTPFPYRALTVSSAQSTLSFTSAPVEVPQPEVSVGVSAPFAEPELIVHEPITSPSPEADSLAAAAFVSQAGAVQEPALQVDATSAYPEGPALRETFADVPVTPAVLLQEPAPAIEIEPAVAEPQPIWQSEGPGQTAEPPPPPIIEPELPIAPPAREPEPERPEIREPEPEGPEVIREPPAAPEHEPAMPTAAVAAAPPLTSPQVPARQAITPRLGVRPPPRTVTHQAPTMNAQDMAKVHPPPDSLPLSSPPTSSGMPTFKEISEASGPPDISPFEPPKESHTAADQELKEFVANFHWMPPAETADELTMRSEVPVIDKKEPEEFHHPSFDDDVAPPPEAGPHPTGQEFYEPDGTAPRPRFLDVGHKPESQPVASGKSLLGFDSAPSQIPPEELAGGSKGHGWLWIAILALVAIFGGLAYLEGEAQSTHAFRGPVQFVKEEYSKLRDRLLTKVEPTAVAPESKQPETQKPRESPAKPETSAQPATTQTDTAQQGPPETSPSNTSSQPRVGQSSNGTQSAAPAGETQAMNTALAKPVEAPPTKSSSSKPQPGQQELAKALDASDSAAAAAWLWKSTSRGNPEAPVRLADMYIKGNGVTKSCEQALVLLRSAAMKENAPARNRLAALYANGTCVARDRVKAYQLMSSALAADPTSEWAKENRQQLWNQMTSEQRAEAQKVH